MDEVKPDEVPPDDTIQNEAVPDEAIPNEAASDEALLDEALPDEVVAEDGLPEGQNPSDDGRVSLLHDLELDATLQFGSREMLLRDVLALGPGDVVELDRHISEPVDLVVGDRIVARGEVVVASGNFALRITEVATPQLRLESMRCLF